MKMSCCLNCHFMWEEKNAFRYLPQWARALLQNEHDDLRVREMPWEAVEAHAKKEMGVFRMYCPRHIVAYIEADHRKLVADHAKDLAT